METCYAGAIAMPSSYAVMDEEEMMYTQGGWNLKFTPTKKCGLYTGVDVVLNATVSDCAWIVASSATFCATLGALGLPILVIGPVISTKAFIIGAAFVAFAATVVATNDMACGKSFTCKKHIGF